MTSEKKTKRFEMRVSPEWLERMEGLRKSSDDYCDLSEMIRAEMDAIARRSSSSLLAQHRAMDKAIRARKR
jgi:hypothetical protein